LIDIGIGDGVALGGALSTKDITKKGGDTVHNF
jgi:hypothetical protein